MNARALACTPLMLVVHGEGTAGAGSGVLVHPRVILTAEHVVPEGARSVMAFVDSGTGEAVRIERVVRGRPEGFWDGDWALIVLAEPFGSLRAQVATRMAEADRPLPSPGEEVVIAGFPIVGGSPMERNPVVITTRAVAPPSWLSRGEDVFFAHNTRDDAARAGASGSPVFARVGGVPVLIGVYGGTADAKVLGIRTSRHLVIQRLPTGAIGEVVAKLGGLGTDLQKKGGRRENRRRRVRAPSVGEDADTSPGGEGWELAAFTATRGLYHA